MALSSLAGQADWPKELVKGGVNLVELFSRIRSDPSESERLQKWFFSPPNIESSGEPGGEHSALAAVADEAAPRLSGLAATTDDQRQELARALVRELVLRVYNFLSPDGEIPKEGDVSVVQQMIKEGRLERVFPAYEDSRYLAPGKTAANR